MVEIIEGKYCYSASQPEELALIKAASAFGIKLVHKDTEGNVEFWVEFLKETRKYKILNVMDFSSERKRMSVLI